MQLEREARRGALFRFFYGYFNRKIETFRFPIVRRGDRRNRGTVWFLCRKRCPTWRAMRSCACSQVGMPILVRSHCITRPARCSRPKRASLSISSWRLFGGIAWPNALREVSGKTHPSVLASLNATAMAISAQQSSDRSRCHGTKMIFFKIDNPGDVPDRYPQKCRRTIGVELRLVVSAFRSRTRQNKNLA